MNSIKTPYASIVAFRPGNWKRAHCFYFDALKAAGINSDEITPEAILANDAEIQKHVHAIENAISSGALRLAMRKAIAARPLNGRILYTLSHSFQDAAVALSCALALRQLVEHTSREHITNSTIENAALLLGGFGMDALFDAMIFLDLDNHIFPELIRAMEREPDTTDYILSVLLRLAAIHDVDPSKRRHSDGLYATVRELLSEQSFAGTFADAILICDIANEYLCHGSTDHLASLLDTYRSSPPSADMEMMVEELSDEVPNFAELLAGTMQPQAMPHGDPMRDLHRLMERENFTSEEDVNAFMQQFKTSPIPELPFEELTDEERAEDLVDRISLIPEAERGVRLRELSETFAHCMIPWLALSADVTSEIERLQCIERGIANAGEFTTPAFMAQANEQAWSIHRARTYLGLLHAKMVTLVELGAADDAIAVGETIRKLEQRDVIGSLHLLLTLYIRRGIRDYYDRAELLLASLESSSSNEAGLQWIKLLLLMIRKRPTLMIDEAFTQAMHALPWVGLMLAELEPFAIRTAIAEPPEALHDTIVKAYHESSNAWYGHPDELKRLKKMVKGW